MEPHTIAGAARRMGTSKWAVKQAKRKLRRAGFEVPDAQHDMHARHAAAVKANAAKQTKRRMQCQRRKAS
jgi:hypothetical protein